MITLQFIVSIFFIAILLGIITVYMGYTAVKESPNYELKRRLRKLALTDDEILPADVQLDILQDMSPLDKFILDFSLLRRLDRLVDNAGFKIDVKIFILIILAIALAGFSFGLYLGRGILFAILLLIIFFVVPFFFLMIRKNARVIRFTEQLPDALDMVSRSLKAGHSISSAIQVVGKEMPEPVSGLFKTAYEEQTYGLSMRDALSHMLERMQSVDLRLFVTAVNIHRDVGGNLAETLERLAQTIRERIRIRRQIRVYTAQGRLSGYILLALPIFMALFLYTVSPDYLEELVIIDEGKYAIAFAVIAQVVGFLVIRKLINIRI